MTIKFFEFSNSSIINTKRVDSVHYYPVDCDETTWEISVRVHGEGAVSLRSDYDTVKREYNAIRVILLEETGVDDDLE